MGWHHQSSLLGTDSSDVSALTRTLGERAKMRSEDIALTVIVVAFLTFIAAVAIFI
jgi:hypothetical protein